MADYLVTDTELTSIADAIRTKGGTTASLTFPSGFISAISDIQTGTTPTGTISISSNGTYNVEAFAQAEVVVPTLSLASLSVSQNGTYNPSSGYAFDSVVVNVAGGGGADKATEAALIGHTISGYYENSVATGIYSYAFYSCAKLTSVNFQNVTIIRGSAFYGCTSMTNVSFPEALSIYSDAFRNCTELTEAIFPLATNVSGSAFYGCTKMSYAEFQSIINLNGNMFVNCASLGSVSLVKCWTIGSSAFMNCSKLSLGIFGYSATAGGNGVSANAFIRCYNLLSLYLLQPTMMKLQNANAFNSTPISTYTTSTGGVNGSVFVPSSLYASYTTATNWTTYSARIVSLTDAQIQNVITYGKHDP